MFTIHSLQLSKLIVYYSISITFKSVILLPHFACDVNGNCIDKVLKFQTLLVMHQLIGDKLEIAKYNISRCVILLIPDGEIGQINCNIMGNVGKYTSRMGWLLHRVNFYISKSDNRQNFFHFNFIWYLKLYCKTSTRMLILLLCSTVFQFVKQ